MHLQIISVGQKMPRWVEVACDDYGKRLPREMVLQWTTLPLARGKAKQSVEQLKRQEAEQIAQKISPGSYSLALDERGSHWSSQDWSENLARWMREYPRVNLIIGGPDGLDASLRRTCNQSVALGAMTLPHALVRVVLVEQLYRAWTILQGHPYHRE